MTDVKHAEKPATKLRAPEPAEITAAAPALTYKSMDTAPKDGKVIRVTSDGRTFVEAHYRTTRRWEKGWVATAFWAAWPGTARMSFDPIGWLPR